MSNLHIQLFELKVLVRQECGNRKNTCQICNASQSKGSHGCTREIPKTCVQIASIQQLLMFPFLNFLSQCVEQNECKWFMRASIVKNSTTNPSSNCNVYWPFLHSYRQWLECTFNWYCSTILLSFFWYTRELCLLHCACASMPCEITSRAWLALHAAGFLYVLPGPLLVWPWHVPHISFIRFRL